MAKRKRRRRYRSMLDPMLDVVGIGVTSSVVGSSGATGATRTLLQQIPTFQAARALRKQTRRVRFY